MLVAGRPPRSPARIRGPGPGAYAGLAVRAAAREDRHDLDPARRRQVHRPDRRRGRPALTADFARHPGPKHGPGRRRRRRLAGAGRGHRRAAPDDRSPWWPARRPPTSATTSTAPGPGSSSGSAWSRRSPRPSRPTRSSSAEPVTGSADEARGELESLAKYLAEGGVISVAVAGGRVPAPAAPARSWTGRPRSSASAATWCCATRRRVRVHRLRFTPAERRRWPSGWPRCTGPVSVPLTRSMHIDSNGVAAAGDLPRRRPRWLAPPGRSRSWWLLPALAAAPVAAFFRDPERDVPDDPRAVVAASDGKVLGVERIRDERFGAGRVPAHRGVPVRARRARQPGAGRRPGGRLLRRRRRLRRGDEAGGRAQRGRRTRCWTPTTARWWWPSAPGLIARRIVQRAPVGALLARGERFGLIRFGSRTDVYLPADARRRRVVGPGDQVLGGETVIARWTADPADPAASLIGAGARRPDHDLGRRGAASGGEGGAARGDAPTAAGR